MEIELRKVSFNPRIDKRSFAANLVVDGIKAGNVVSNHNGTQYYPVNRKGQELIEKAEKFCEKLPAKATIVNGKEQETKQSLSSFIGELFAAHLETLEQVKFNKKVDVAMKQNIVIGEPLKYIRTFRTQSPIDILTLSQNGNDLLLNTLVMEVIPSLSANEKLLNNNIPVDILKAAGLKETQYVKQSPEYMMKQAPKKNKGRSL